MKRFHLFFSIITILTALLISAAAFAQESGEKDQTTKSSKVTQSDKSQKGIRGFVDANGDGYNDNAPDADGDGIPNGRDEDYTGAKLRKGNNAKGFVDADGDGINDNMMDADGDGIPNGRDEDFTGKGKQNKQGFGKGKMGRGRCYGNGTCSPQTRAGSSK